MPINAWRVFLAHSAFCRTADRRHVRRTRVRRRLGKLRQERRRRSDRGLHPRHQIRHLQRPHPALAYSNRGVEWKAKGELTKAIADYDEAIKNDPQQAAAYNNRGIAYASAADYDRLSPTTTRRSS